MRVKRLLLGSIVVVIIWIIIPLFLILLNNHFKLPIVDNSVIKFIGLLFFITGLSVVIRYTQLHLKTGRTTPLTLIEPPRRLIIKGFYKYSRNPMYLAILTAFLGQFFILGHLLLFIYFLVSIPALHLFIVFVEEPELKRKFGEEYLKYTKRVPRWLPKIMRGV